MCTEVVGVNNSVYFNMKPDEYMSSAALLILSFRRRKKQSKGVLLPCQKSCKQSTFSCTFFSVLLKELMSQGMIF